MDRRWIVLAAVFLARTSMGYQFQSIGSVGPFLISELAIDLAVLGSLIGAYKLPGLFLAIPSGMLGQRFGEKSLLVLGMLLMAVGGVMSARSGSVDVMYVGRILSGVGAVAFNVLSSKMIADWFAERELTVAMSIHVNSWPFGIALGLATQAAFAEAYSLSGMLMMSALFCGAGVLLLLFGASNRQVPAPGGSASLKFGLGGREFLLVSTAAMIWMLFNANLIVVVSFAPAYLVSQGYEAIAAGQLASTGIWIGVVAVPLGGLIVQKWINGDLFMVAMFLGGAAATMSLIFLDDRLIAFIAIGLLAWSPAGAIIAVPVQILSPANRAMGMGIFFSYYYLGIGILPSVAGYLGDVTGDPAAPILFATALLLLALCSLITLRLLQRRTLVT
ncbi:MULTISPECIES: MFS transporter [unclassified Minwuia]|jgi:predicted MFS family arabinose efflux permease|uniref:MFS transporter n=1 Tax=unclassified Minwuia TaxID=2618799 RepID=UPI00247B1D0C|nr:MULTISPECIES: MFS transporter [unclassified Minwuia]